MQGDTNVVKLRFHNPHDQSNRDTQKADERQNHVNQDVAAVLDGHFRLMFCLSELPHPVIDSRP